MNSILSLFALTFILTSKSLTLLGKDIRIQKQFEILTSITENSTSVIASRKDEFMASHIILNLKERHIYVYQNSEVIANYKVAIGKEGWETPKGNFSVMQMVENPQWKNPWNGRISAAGPNSPLGERWIAFSRQDGKYVGFHGTSGEHSMGKAVSHGCVRMRNKDVKELYGLVGLGVPVVVQ
ncbi:L,D-transpeptidase [Candidatus Atelocyanobacterium thalassae]|uniref:L,D-TPase catalytic domain-containing protein n=1 Tax=cyanobacterium endosymbiont of Braarudosphaera bigelowii TaxID=1285375 RepID=A0ABM7U6B2_9CHRO|nr:L,D-transpeptidase [Candidatus Atelocyanobacterium thalassa]BDA40338.1 hypothetical protein CPARK_000117600 [cyanobacterium endosymbiont of Braarudosphaera bigelowii]